VVRFRLLAVHDGLDLAALLDFNPTPHTNSNSANSVGRAASENGTAGTSSDGRDRGDGSDGDEDGRQGGHDFRMFGYQEVHSFGGVEEPEWGISNRGDSYGAPGSEAVEGSLGWKVLTAAHRFASLWFW